MKIRKQLFVQGKQTVGEGRVALSLPVVDDRRHEDIWEGGAKIKQKLSINRWKWLELPLHDNENDAQGKF